LTQGKEEKKRFKIKLDLTYSEVAPEQAIRLGRIMARLLQPCESGAKKRGREDTLPQSGTRSTAE
jgi:hypothetical protein